MNWKTFFKGKKITLMGLGLLGRGVGDAAFLAQCGAEVLVTDLKPSTALGSSLAKLRKYKNIRYTLGEHKIEDFRNCDFILKAAGVPLDSPFITEARKHKVPVHMSTALFAKFAREAGATIVGVTGTRGKSTVTHLIYHTLKKAGRRVHLGGNVKGVSTLALLPKIKKGDVCVLELDSWQLQGFHDSEISPQIAVFTTFLDDHLIYYKGDKEKYLDDKKAIFEYQNKGDVLIVGEQASNHISSGIIARAADIPKNWNIKLLGEHNRENIACAIAAARALDVSDLIIKKAVENFETVPGRLEYLRTIRGIKIYNDNNATTPDATIAGLQALGTRKNIVLICGGTDKGLDMSKLVAEIPKHCKVVILLTESGTEKLKKELADFTEKETLKECVEEAMEVAKKGDIILFSPAFASFGRWFKNEYDRGEQFVSIVTKLK